MELDFYEVTGRYDEVAKFYSSVGEESRYLRFLAAVKDPASIYSHMWSCGGRSFLVVEGRRPVALVDVTPCGDEAEAGIVVVDSLQGRGYGTRIAEVFAELLPRLGFDVVKAEIYRENLKALSIARRLGASVACRGIICTVRLDLRRRALRGVAALKLAATP
ncbi:MAG: GNAT family N-acetyltransferase [Thermoproteus sp.]